MNNLLNSWIYNSINSYMFSYVFDLPSFAHEWCALLEVFHSLNCGQVIELHYQLSQVKKGSLSMLEYFVSVKALAHHLL